MSTALHLDPRRSRRHRVGLAAVFAVLLFVVSVVGGVVHRLYSSLDTIGVQITGQSGETVTLPTDLSAGRPLNILIIGTDDRSGANEGIGGAEEGARADTTILVHVDADRSRVRMASIPRDLMVYIPECASAGQEPSLGEFTQFNAAFSTGYGNEGDLGGAVACVMKTVQGATGILPDAAVVLDFQAVVGVVDAMGGVEICGQEQFAPEMAGGLVLEPGCHTVNGMQAVQFLRARYVGTDGSDLARIDRQQCFMRQAGRQLLSGGMLAQATKVLSVAQVIADHTTVTDNLASVPALAGFLASLKDLPPGALQTASPPLTDYEPDPNRVAWGEGAQEFWADFNTDAAAATTTQSGDTAASGATSADTATEPPTGGGEAPQSANVAPSVEYCY